MYRAQVPLFGLAASVTSFSFPNRDSEPLSSSGRLFRKPIRGAGRKSLTCLQAGLRKSSLGSRGRGGLKPSASRGGFRGAWKAADPPPYMQGAFIAAG